jgi:hypothetical protein
MKRPRWDPDARGEGVTDATRFAPDVDALAAAMREPNWIAEEPEAHLLPHLRRAVEASDGRWRLDGVRNEDGLLELLLTSSGDGGDRPHARLRADAFALIGAVAEAASLVRERPGATETIFDVTTGMLNGDGSFAPHGHLLRLRVRLPSDGMEVPA